MFSKLEEIKKALNAKFYEREKEVEALMVAVLSRQHMLMIGPAGTAKSALSSQLAKIVQDTKYFQWLLTRFSTPEELFGPLSLKELEQGVYKRNTTGKMPEAHLVFIDEIFKSNSAILNSLLTLINERLFYNNGTPIKVPLMSVIGSSNEYPEEDEGLEALFDRFLLRFEVSYIGDNDNFISMLKGNGQPQDMPSLTLEELMQFQFYSDMVSIPDDIYDVISRIRIELRDEGIRPSDRRFKQSLSVLQAKAILNQRQQVEFKDLLILENALWETVEQKETVSEIVRKYSFDQVERTLQQIQAESTEILRNWENEPSTDAALEATKKIKDLIAQLGKLKGKNPNRESEILSVLQNVKEDQQKVLDSILLPTDENL